MPLLVLGLTNLDAKADTRQFALAPGASLAPKTAVRAKLGHELLRLYNEFNSFQQTFGLDAAPQFRPRNRLIKLFRGRVAIEAVAAADTDRLLSDLRQLNLQNFKKYKRHVSGHLPIRALIQMAALDSLKFARPALFTTNAGLVQSQGDRAMRTDLARPFFNVNGSGIKLGILSDSFNCQGQAAIDVANGDLPSGIEVLDDSGCPISNSDEGRALMQIITDIAPGADQAFHTAIGGQAVFAQGILDLADAGCDIIVDDIIYFAEPMFQDGIVAQAIDAVVERGIAYFSAAGNSARRSYESAFNSSGIDIILEGIFYGVAHDYDPGPGVDILQQVTLPGNTSLMVSFQWDAPSFSVSGAPGSPNDLDIFVVDGAESTVLEGSTYLNTGADPIEVLVFTNPSSQADQFNLLITHYSGSVPGRMKMVIINSSTSINEYNTSSSTLFGHANAAGAIAVAAAFYEATPVFGVTPAMVEPFSSAGGVPILFDRSGSRFVSPQVRHKPDVAAPDGANTTFFGSVDIEPDGFPNFFGTSAAAPHAAGAAALLLEADNSLSPNQLIHTLSQTALDMIDPAFPELGSGFDFVSGWGLIQADQAVAVGNDIFYVEINGECRGKQPCFQTIQSAINAVPQSQSIINIRNETFNEDVSVNQPNATIRVRGGWDSDFLNRASTTTLTGDLELAGGTIIPENLVFE
jgi:hypothetical protein